MMTNLFSVFDPSSSLGPSVNWSTLILSLLLFPVFKWGLSSRSVKLMDELLSNFSKEISPILNSQSKFSIVMFNALFVFILMNNLMGLVPYVFTPTSHMVVTLGLSLPLWLGYFSYGWWKSYKWMFAHLMPQGTPLVLMPFMVMIESVSSLIRPMTLAVRLMANMVAGHLLLTLASSAVQFSMWFSPVLIVSLQILLIILEVAVAMIQSYVFVVLSVLYSSEV